jgi:hypothetical protein
MAKTGFGILWSIGGYPFGIVSTESAGAPTAGKVETAAIILFLDSIFGNQILANTIFGNHLWYLNQ